MKHVGLGLGVVLAMHTQIAGLIILAFLGEPYLEKNLPIGFPWWHIILPVTFGAVIHSYFVLFTFLVKLERKKK